MGAGIGGLTLALALHEVGIHARVYEAAAEIRALGVGINILPHASKTLALLGLGDALGAAAVEPDEAAFFNRFGQLAYSEPLGRAAGYAFPQYSIHRGALQAALYRAVRERIGDANILLDRRCTSIVQDAGGVCLRLKNSAGELASAYGSVAIGCDGVNSIVRRHLHPNEGPPRYSGVTMWRGITRREPVLTGRTFVRAGWLTHGKLVVYPIGPVDERDGTQAVNWVAEVETPQRAERDWTKRGRIEDFLPAFADWCFPWLDVPALFGDAEQILEYPMVDQEPLSHWTIGRITLLGDAAHPMVPRGSNGAGQAILDARALADELAGGATATDALARYEALRRPATTRVVLMNRENPPDAILRVVYERSGDRPFHSIDAIVSRAELQAISDSYKRVAGYDVSGLHTR